MDRIDPDQHAIELSKLCAHLLANIVRVDDRLCIHAGIGQRREDGLEVACLRRGALRRAASSPRQRTAILPR